MNSLALAELQSPQPLIPRTAQALCQFLLGETSLLLHEGSWASSRDVTSIGRACRGICAASSSSYITACYYISTLEALFELSFLGGDKARFYKRLFRAAWRCEAGLPF